MTIFSFARMSFFRNRYNTITTNWQQAIADEGFRRYFLPNFVLCFTLYSMTIYWVSLNSNRAGMIITDPLYPFLPRYDFSWAIFFLTYSCTLLLLFDIAQYPFLLHRAFVAFVAVFVVRAICIHFVPLSPSPAIIPLQDPITNSLAGEGHIMNDLFFSGHVADVTTFYLLCRNTMIRRYMFVCICGMALFLVCQRVHYTVDVIVAPVFSYFSYWVFVEKDLIWKPFLKQPGSVQSPDRSLAE